MSTRSKSPQTEAEVPRARRSAASAFGMFLGLSALGGVLVAGLTAPGAAALGTVTEASTTMLSELPSSVELPEPSQQSVMRYADGSHMATFFAENRIVVPLEQISPRMQQAVVAIEDRRFYEHAGFDPQGMARALVNNLAGGQLEGASTLTQQYVRNSLIEAGRQSGDAEEIDAATETSIGRKLREISLAIALEKQVSKDEILAGYLNIAQFGPSQYGVEAGSRHYFSIPASELNIVQAATLAGITQSPNRWDPVDHPEDAKTRRDTVLMVMHSEGFISEAEYQEAVNTSIEETLNVSDTSNGCAASGNAAYFCEYVVKDLLNNDAWGESREERTRMLYRGGLVIDTTLDPRLQEAAFASATRTVPVADASGIDASVVSVEPGTGKILAMAQNTEFGLTAEGQPDTTQVNVNVGRSHGGGLGFQAGSAFKVFTLAEWLESGRSIYDNVNQAERNYTARSWTVPCAPELAANYPVSNLYRMSGTTSVLRATKLSVNVPFVDMANKLDLCQIMDTAAAMGVERGDGEKLVPQPAAVLGTNEVTPLSMANAFATFGARGLHCEPVAISRLSELDGTEIATVEPQCEQVLPEGVADSANVALQAVMQPGGTGDASALRGRPSAGKTGTANDAANGWMVGYTPQNSTAVWTGHRAGNKPMMNVRVNGRYHRTVFGSTLAGPIWQDFMVAAHDGLPVEQFAAPPRRAPETSNRGRSGRSSDNRALGPAAQSPQAPGAQGTDLTEGEG